MLLLRKQISGEDDQEEKKKGSNKQYEDVKRDMTNTNLK